MSSRLYSQDDDDGEIMLPLSPTSNGMANGGVVSRRRDENRKNQSNNDVRDE